MANSTKLRITVDGTQYPVTAEYSEDALFDKDQTLVKIPRDSLPLSLRVAEDYAVEGFPGVDSMRVISETRRNWILRFVNA